MPKYLLTADSEYVSFEHILNTDICKLHLRHTVLYKFNLIEFIRLTDRENCCLR